MKQTIDRPDSNRPVALAKYFFQMMQADDLPGTAAAMAYYFMLSLFPALIMFIAVIDFLPLDIPMERVGEQLAESLPGDAGQLVLEYLKNFAETKPSALVSLWGLVILWAASRGLAGTRQALNKVFGMKERRSALRLRVVSVFMTIAVFAFIGLAYALLILGPQFGQWLVDWFGIGDEFPRIWAMLRIPLVISLLTAFIVLCYRYLPYRRVPFRYLLGGAIPAVGGWILVGTLFRLYLKNFGKYDEVYGSLTSVILLLMFLWISSLLLLFGAEIAAWLAAIREPVEVDDRPK